MAGNINDLKAALEKEAAELKKKSLEAAGVIEKGPVVSKMNPSDAEARRQKVDLRKRQDERSAKRYFQSHERIDNTGQLDGLAGSGLEVRRGDASIKLKRKDNRRDEQSYKKELRDEAKDKTEREKKAEEAKDGKDGKAKDGKDGSSGKDGKNAGSKDSAHDNVNKENAKASRKSDESQLSANEIARVRELLQKLQ